MKEILQALTLLGSVNLAFAVNANERTNVVLIVADDLGFTPKILTNLGGNYI
ncbi:hypothetical protein HBA55_29060 [Pseudomaricurvus alkylphenolicus]|jgi:hypothetical protein|uniref:hypothetical protein n=1 Tax=Pseudomaricurvus alkylphenolicus TaxID=1306991 RepID=UPI001421D9E3|nr:hypothetical protein [Pseudomaricurvus alkylphenolicus]NIB43694.1 hypothetical protein [Pseudomaricurvus alkylphenolicus]